MTRENIEGMREVILPFVKKKLLEINYENLGKSDAEEFERYFNEILDLALKALEQESTTKNNLGVDCISRAEVLKIFDEWFATCDIADKKDSPKAKIKALPSVTPQEPRKGHWIGQKR